MHFIDSALISKYGELHDFFLHTWRPSGPGPCGFLLKDKIYKNDIIIILYYYCYYIYLEAQWTRPMWVSRRAGEGRTAGQDWNYKLFLRLYLYISHIEIINVCKYKSIKKFSSCYKVSQRHIYLTLKRRIVGRGTRVKKPVGEIY